jgi:hypothetical protein
MKKLFLVHCGFYDLELCNGIYESHVNFFVAAESFEDARIQVKTIPEFVSKKMHVDGLQEIVSVMGNRLTLEADASLNGLTQIMSSRHRDLAPKPQVTTS